MLNPGLKHLPGLLGHDRTTEIIALSLAAGAMLIVGQKRSKEPTALTAEPRCTSDSNSRRDNPRPSSFLTKSLTLITTLKAWPLLIATFYRVDKSLSCSREKGWLVGAVGIETGSLTSKSRQRKALPTAPHPKC